MGLYQIISRLTRGRLVEAGGFRASWPVERGWSATGETITPERAMRFGAVFACVRAVSETIATLPKHVYRSEAKRRKVIDKDHPAHGLIYNRPNPEQTDVEFWEMMIGHMELRGNAYAEIERVRGIPVGLWPMNPDRVTPKRVGGVLLYEIQLPTGGLQTLRGENVLHLRMMSLDGFTGLSQIKAASVSVGLSLAAQEYGARVFANGGLKRQALISDQPIKDQALLADMRLQWEQAYGGLSNAHRVAVLSGGLKPQEIGVSPEDAQLLELLSAGVTDICRIFRVPPHKIAQLDKATFSNIEEQNIDWVTDSILPRTVRIEKRLNTSLLNNDEQRYIKFNLDGLLRGDYKSRMEGHQVAIINGIKSPNECRDDEDLDPYEAGDEFRVPLNTGPAGGEDVEDDPAVDGEAESASVETVRETRARRALEQENLRKAFQPILAAAYRRLIRRGYGELVGALEKHLGVRNFSDFDDWAAEFVEKLVAAALTELETGVKGLAAAVANQAAASLGGVVPANMDALAGQLAKKAAERQAQWFGDRIQAIKAGYGEEYTLDIVRAEAQKYADELAEFFGEREAVFVDGDIRRNTYKENGVTRLVWVASGSETCPLCQELDGKVVGIESDFATGVNFPSGFNPRTNVFHPPLHDGCVCSIMPE